MKRFLWGQKVDRHRRRVEPRTLAVFAATAAVGGILVLLSVTGGQREEARVEDPRVKGGLQGERAVLRPDPGMSPQEVVKLQMAALRGNGSGDRGIRQCYQFASPLNRAATGPLARFVTMVESPPYDVMLRARDALVGAAVVREDHAAVLVTLIDVDRNIRVFRFILSKQKESPFEDCWMTDAVRELVFQGPVAPRQGQPEAQQAGV